MSTDAYSRAILDHYRGERDQPLIERDGEQTREHPIEQHYFQSFSADTERGQWIESLLDGPLLDIGAGAGRDSLHFQNQQETVAIEINEHLVELLTQRGVEDARRGDMFSLRETFDRDRFQSLLCQGTQMGLAGSMDGLREFLSDLAYITRPGGTALLDSYDPTRSKATELLGYRPDATPGLAFRVQTFEYEGHVDDTLLFRLFSPDRLREATVGTPWELTEIDRGEHESEPHYLAALVKNTGNKPEPRH